MERVTREKDDAVTGRDLAEADLTKLRTALPTIAQKVMDSEPVSDKFNAYVNAVKDHEINKAVLEVIQACGLTPPYPDFVQKKLNEGRLRIITNDDHSDTSFHEDLEDGEFVRDSIDEYDVNVPANSLNSGVVNGLHNCEQSNKVEKEMRLLLFFLHTTHLLSRSLQVLMDNDFTHQNSRTVNLSSLLNLLRPGSSVHCFFINVYSPQDRGKKRHLWMFLSEFLSNNPGEHVLFGDFNAVRSSQERQGSEFCPLSSSDFNNFITASDLVDLPLGGRAFARSSKFCDSRGKLDRFLISNDFIDSIPNLIGRVLPNLWSDHCPILLVVDRLNFGPSPFKLCASWFLIDGFDNVVQNAWLDPLFKRVDTLKINRSSKHLKSLPAVLANELEKPFSEAEVKSAVWGCGDDKASGPDGFSFCFIKHFWELIKQEVMAFVTNFHSTGFIPKGCNSSFFTMIPKVENPLYVKDFLPISLIGVQYKILAKLLANRLSLVIENVISREQSAFIKGHQILDGPLIINEVLGWCKRKRKKAMLLKVDFEKAFDSISWDFLCTMLDSLGFGRRWTLWIKGCLRSSFASVLINGCRTEEFNIERGLRQGDPLSAFLFIICMEGLHVAILDAIDHNLFKGLIVEIKTPRFFCHSLSLQMMTFSLENWKPIITKVEKRLANWKMNLLTFGGRLTLIKSVLGALGTYYLSLYKAPKNVLKHLESLRSHFLWGGTKDDRKIHWIKWDDVLKSKDKGGLGVVSFESLNKALLYKWRWRYVNCKGWLWVSIIQAIHGVQMDGLHPVINTVSGTWASIYLFHHDLHVQNPFLSNVLSIKIGIGVDTFFWLHNWIDNTPLRDKFNRLFALETDHSCKVLESVHANGFNWSWRRPIR
ncbi:uncharacterized protein [Rutidosis leptorrhynchoides]|uniref:uncharacterized protein n=1 Tax=Rutidosis leptorrhynchoides TaxID=125765 RepID=UPI003A993BD0